MYEINSGRGITPVLSVSFFPSTTSAGTLWIPNDFVSYGKEPVMTIFEWTFSFEATAKEIRKKAEEGQYGQVVVAKSGARLWEFHGTLCDVFRDCLWPLAYRTIAFISIALPPEGAPKTQVVAEIFAYLQVGPSGFVPDVNRALVRKLSAQEI